MFSPAPDWLRFAEQASSVNLAPWVTLRNTVRTANDYNTTVRSAAMRGRVIADLDSLVAEAEIARFIGHKSTPPVDDLTQSLLEAAVYAFFYAIAAPAAGSDEMTTIARGIRASRELHDAGQRFLFARDNASAFDGLTFAEALALHRAEGAFCMPPPDASKLHAPLILTEPTLPTPPDPSEFPARTQSTFANVFGLPFERPGFVPTIGGIPTNNNVRDLLVASTNAICMGLDNIVSWPVTFDNASDELSLLLAKARQDDVGGLGTLLAQWETGLTGVDARHLSYVALAILMSHLEADDTLTGDQAIANVISDLAALRSCTPVVDAGSIGLFDDDARSNARAVLRLATRWYASRTRPETLLAHRDRMGFVAMPRLSPYMSYLRFHSGDVIFGGLVLRAARELAALRTQWTAARNRASFADAIVALGDADFGAALDASDFVSMTASDTGAIANSLALWRNNTTGARYVRGQGESVWRHVGLLSQIVAPWKPPPPPPSDTGAARMSALADAMLATMTIIRDRGLLKPISLALEYMPVARLFGIASFNEKNWAANLRKTENFERLRRFIDAARVRASLDERGSRLP